MILTAHWRYFLPYLLNIAVYRPEYCGLVCQQANYHYGFVWRMGTVN